MFTLNDVRTKTEPVGNWSKWVIHPLSDRLLVFIANHTQWTPNTLTLLSFAMALIAAPFFCNGSHPYLVAGGVLYELSFALDAMDGTLARLKNLKSHMGAFIDPYLDTWKGLILSIALLFGQYRQNDTGLFLLEIWFIFIFMAQPLFYEITRKAAQDKKEEILKGVRDKISKKGKTQDRMLYPFTIVEFQTIAFFIFPLLNKVKSGLFLASLLGTINMLAINFIFILAVARYERRK